MVCVLGVTIIVAAVGGAGIAFIKWKEKKERRRKEQERIERLRRQEDCLIDFERYAENSMTELPPGWENVCSIYGVKWEDEKEKREGDETFKDDLSIYARGIKNIKRDCFVNALLQCFLGMPDFCDKVRKEAANKGTCREEEEKCDDVIDWKNAPEGNSVLKILSKFISKYEVDSHEVVNGRFLRRYFEEEFPSYQQHDARQFFMALFEAIQLEQNPSNEKFILFKKDEFREDSKITSVCYHSVIDEFFIGVYETKFCCNSCKTETKVLEEFNHVPLYLTVGAHPQESFINFLERPIQNNSVRMKCSSCKEESEFGTKTRIARYPKYLIFAIERIDSFHRRKITDFCDYPVEFIQKYPDGSENIKYRLHSTISHSGSLNSGHYTAISKRSKGWMYFNDRKVKYLTKDELKIGGETVLIYKTDSN